MNLRTGFIYMEVYQCCLLYKRALSSSLLWSLRLGLTTRRSSCAQDEMVMFATN